MKEHLQMVAPGIYLWICRSFSEHLRTAYFIYKLQDFNQHIKLFHRYLSRFCKRTRSNYSKVFIWLKPLKVICEEVNLQWSCEMLACTFTKKIYFTHLPSCILPSFSKNASRLLLPKSLWKGASTLSFRKYKQKVLLLVIYNYDSSKSGDLSQLRRKKKETKRKALQEHPSFCSNLMFWYVPFYKTPIWW